MSSNNNTDNNTRRQHHADRMANINFRRLQDECSTLCAEYTAMRAQMDAMSSYMASIQQQQPPPSPTPNPVPEMDKQCMNHVIVR